MPFFPPSKWTIQYFQSNKYVDVPDDKKPQNTRSAFRAWQGIVPVSTEAALTETPTFTVLFEKHPAIPTGQSLSSQDHKHQL